jgi:hypothetical protein
VKRNLVFERGWLMTAMINFFKTMLKLPFPWLVWVSLLMCANMVVPVYFFGTLEGKLVLLAAMAGAGLQTWIFSSKGFVRLLGAGHFPWILLVIWLWLRLGQTPSDGIFRYWIISVIVLDAISLLIDLTDVVRYIMGDRKPQVEL